MVNPYFMEGKRGYLTARGYMQRNAHNFKAAGVAKRRLASTNTPETKPTSPVPPSNLQQMT